MRQQMPTSIWQWWATRTRPNDIDCLTRPVPCVPPTATSTNLSVVRPISFVLSTQILATCRSSTLKWVVLGQISLNDVNWKGAFEAERLKRKRNKSFSGKPWKRPVAPMTMKKRSMELLVSIQVNEIDIENIFALECQISEFWFDFGSNLSAQW